MTSPMVDAFNAATEVFHKVLFELHNYNQLLKLVMVPHRPLDDLVPLAFPTYDATNYLGLYNQVGCRCPKMRDPVWSIFCLLLPLQSCILKLVGATIQFLRIGLPAQETLPAAFQVLFDLPCRSFWSCVHLSSSILCLIQYRHSWS